MRKLCYILLLVVLGFHCREKYEVLLPPTENSLLVVEGVINASGSTDIQLSRTTALAERGIIPEMGAVVMVEGEDNSSFQLTPLDSGHYFANQVPMNPANKYRLKIITQNNKEYQSDYREILTTQNIDSVSIQPEGEDVRFFINSQDDKAKKYYFKWDIEETWEIVSTFRTNLKFIVTPVADSFKVQLDYYDRNTHEVNESIHVCWQSNRSTEINIGSTEQLTASNIFLPVKRLKRNSIELGVMYSMLVKQYALSREGYDFYRRMKKNSESLGSIFDAQPSEIVGNIKCTTNPDELVVGFAEFTTAQEKRIFVKSEDLPGTAYDPGCLPFGGSNVEFPYPFEDDPRVLYYVYRTLDLLPTRIVRVAGPSGPSTFEAQNKFCVDCTLSGSNVKPAFWP